MKICYGASRYRSHLRAAYAYCRLLRREHTLVEDVLSADLLILHMEPVGFERMYSNHSTLNSKYVIAYCVWEATELPSAYKRSLEKVQEVWTCSHYCCSILQRYHPRVIYAPHVISRDTHFDDTERARVTNIINYDPDAIYFLCIGSINDRRKNIASLVDVFQTNKALMPRARLVLKSLPNEYAPWCMLPQIVHVPALLTRRELNALYSLCDVYVSAHHSEGWGLTLSDAMLFNKPVIATGYSGNLEYMNERNSFLVQYEELDIHLNDCFKLFTTDMRWAYPDLNDLGRNMRTVYEGLGTQLITERVVNATKYIRRFDEDSVHTMLSSRLAALSDLLGNKCSA